MDIYINIKKPHLFFRKEARAILKKILRKKEIPQNVYLDFSGVNFLSRSFIDELLNISQELKERRILLKIRNLSLPLKKMVANVKKTKMEIQKSLKYV